METLKEIVSESMAKLSHVCNGNAAYIISTNKHRYVLVINCIDSEWKDVYILPEYKSITLMRWIKKGIDSNDGSFIKIV
jgi:ADP-glucose pyrophosphorylase